MKAQPFMQSPSKVGGTPGFRQLCTMGGEGSSSSNMGINPVFDNKAIGPRGGGAPHCVSLSTSPRHVNSVSRVSCMVFDCLSCASISAQNDFSSLRFMIGCGCRGDGDASEESEERGGSVHWVQVTAINGKACNFAEHCCSTVKCSSGLGLSAIRATLILRSLGLEGGIWSI